MLSVFHCGLVKQWNLSFPKAVSSKDAFLSQRPLSHNVYALETEAELEEKTLCLLLAVKNEHLPTVEGTRFPMSQRAASTHSHTIPAYIH